MPGLDFIVIGAQKGGTTALWEHLRRHPGLTLPADKEAPFFHLPEATSAAARAAFLAHHFADAPPGRLRGTVTPHYMMGYGGVPSERIAARIAASEPDVRVVALLRDPIERAASHWQMSSRRKMETRSFEEAVREQLTPAGRRDGVERTTEVNSYVAQGEYGRTLHGFRSHLGAERVLILASERLERSPGAVLDEVLTFLGLEPGFRPPTLGRRFHEGGTRLLADHARAAELHDHLERHVWPHVADPRVREGFEYFFETWNVARGGERPGLEPGTRAELIARYRTDAALLAALGFAAPWLAGWDAEATADRPLAVR